MLKLILVAIALVGMAIAGIAIKLFVLKDGEFKKSCSSVDPNTGKAMACSCGGETDDSCANTI